MAENKFIKHLKGVATAGSVLEIKNQATPASFGNMPAGTSNPNNVYSDHRGNATAVLNGTDNWKLDGTTLVPATDVFGDGRDYTGDYAISGSGLWVNATYIFPSTGDPVHPVAMVFNPDTKWVLKLCGSRLIASGANAIDFTLLVKIGTASVFTKSFTVAENAGQFCQEFVLDFAETNTEIIKASGLSTLTVQLLCATDGASARIYNGMTVLTCLQRKVAASVVSASFANVEEVIRDGLLPSDYFSNAEFIDQVVDGEQAYAVFERDGDTVNLSGWTGKNKLIYKASVMPQASAELLGSVYQYVGQTDGTYQHGYIYECVAGDPSYTGIIGIEPTKIAFDYTRGDIVAFFREITPNFAQITHGTFTYDIAGNIWTIVGKDANENVIFDTYRLYTEDLEDAGFVFINPPEDYHDGDVFDYYVTFTETTTYNWERIDVQPGGSRGRFLALWDCTTGLAETNPPISPYEYKTGDYFVVGVVGATNYRPDGTQYVIGVPSATVETAEVAVDDTYFFDGTEWKLQSNSNKTVSFSGIAGSPYDNTNLASALNAKQDVIADLETIRTGAGIYTHDQAVAASVWTINHNLGKYPSITVVDTGGNVVTGKYSYPDTNTIVAEFNAAFKGTAYLN